MARIVFNAVHLKCTDKSSSEGDSRGGGLSEEREAKATKLRIFEETRRAPFVKFCGSNKHHAQQLLGIASGVSVGFHVSYGSDPTSGRDQRTSV